MTPIRHNGSDGGSDNDAVLDAVRDCVLAVGVRRTTLADVARRAGVSRMTLYRRWPDLRALVGDLMTREWIAVATRAMPDPAPGTGTRTRIATCNALSPCCGGGCRRRGVDQRACMQHSKAFL